MFFFRSGEGSFGRQGSLGWALGGGASIRQGSLGLALGTSCSRGVTQIGLEGALSERGRSNGPLRSFVQGGSSEGAVIDMVAEVARIGPEGTSARQRSLELIVSRALSDKGPSKWPRRSSYDRVA